MQDRPGIDRLGESFFPAWKDAGGGEEWEFPDAMQRDISAMQMWKFVSNTGTKLPNSERMANLIWRMMATAYKTSNVGKRNVSEEGVGGSLYPI
jgi:hypothetical protein